MPEKPKPLVLLWITGESTSLQAFIEYCEMQVEGLQANVERLNAYKSKLVLFPKGAKAQKGEATAEEMAAATQFNGVFLPIEKKAPTFEFMAVTPEMKKHSAFMGLRQARNDARNFGIRAKRAAEKAEEN